MLTIIKSEKISARKTTGTKISFQSHKHLNSVSPSTYLDKDNCINEFLMNSFWSGRTRGKLVIQEKNYTDYPELSYFHTREFGRVSMFISKITWGYPKNKITTYGDVRVPLLEITFGGYNDENRRDEVFFYKCTITVKYFLTIFSKGINMIKDANYSTGERFHSVQMHSLLLDKYPIDAYGEFLALLFQRKATNRDIPRIEPKGIKCVMNVLELARY